MAPAKHRCFLATNSNILDYLTYDFSLRHPRDLTKTAWFCQRMTDCEIQSPPKPIVKLQQTAQHMAKQVKKNHTHRKLNKQQSNENAEKIAINRNVQCANTQ